MILLASYDVNFSCVLGTRIESFLRCVNFVLCELNKRVYILGMNRKHLVIVGGGFGGVTAAQSLQRAKNLDITLIDRRNFHLFQPLLYQVAMAGLSPSDIAIPLRALFNKQKNINVTLAEVDQLDLPQKKIHYDQKWVAYDYLILACGAKHSYFGNSSWESVAPGLKNLEQATEIRRRILTSFELAEKEDDLQKREKYLTFVVVGGGPTGVELAGAISEMARHTLKKDFKRADLSKTKVILAEAGPRILAAFPEDLSKIAQKNLQDLDVEVFTNTRAGELSIDGLRLGDRWVETKTIIWAAGVTASKLTQQLSMPKDKQGRVIVNNDLSLPDNKNVFVIGDQAAFILPNGVTLPGIAPVAIQQGRHVARMIENDERYAPRFGFTYYDKGIMATIGRSKAVVHTFGFSFSGFFAWLAWAFIHILYLMKFKNRFFVFLQWSWSYFTFGRGARLITYKSWKFYDGEKIDLS